MQVFHLHTDINNYHPNLLSSVLKVGVAVNDDGKKMLMDFNCVVNGCVDLRFVLSRVRGMFKW